MRHAVPEDFEKLGYIGQIPGHSHIENQSVNREKFSQSPTDVLYDITGAGHHFDQIVARLTVGELESLDLPNKGTVVHDQNGKVLKDTYRYTFRILHEPERCMYPHCEVRLHVDGEPFPSGKKVPQRVKTEMRRACAEIAERYRGEMNRILGKAG